MFRIKNYKIKYKMNNKLKTQGEAEKQAVVTSSVFLQIGMKVKIKNLPRLYFFNAGKEKTITSDLENFGSLRAFGLDGDDGIWCIEDFQFCINYPNMSMR